MLNLTYSVLAGIFFGLWPLFANKGGLSGFNTAFVFSGLSLLFIFPFAVSEIPEIKNGNMFMLLTAGFTGALGVIFFTSMLSRVDARNASLYFVIMICVQVSVPVIYYIILNKSLNLEKILGLAFAFIAVILLNK